MNSGDPVIAARSMTAGYGDLAAVREVEIEVRPGEVVALLGANGAGKSTVLLAMAGVLPLMTGAVEWLGSPARTSLTRRAKDGLALVPEGRSVIAGLTVADNLKLGRGGVDAALQLFPELEPLLGRGAGLLSGGEQQMLVLARALASDPRCLLVDELSLGLAPLIVIRLLSALRTQSDRTGLAVLLVEQQARRALEVSDRWYLMQDGRVRSSGDATRAPSLEQVYLGSPA